MVYSVYARQVYYTCTMSTDNSHRVKVDFFHLGHTGRPITVTRNQLRVFMLVSFSSLVLVVFSSLSPASPAALSKL